MAGFIAEVGDINRFDSPKQIQKLAGLALTENSSGKHKGKTSISKRGRKKLRKLLFQVVMPLIAKNKEFGEIHKQYISREDNPLKKKQSIVAISCKLIRIFYAILKKGTTYDANKVITMNNTLVSVCCGVLPGVELLPVCLFWYSVCSLASNKA